MSSFNPPTDEDLRRLSVLASRPENRAYFFDRLDNPLWVPQLAERGYFSNPPSPVEADEPGYVRFPPWPEGRYLARVAPEVPSAVGEVLRQAGPSDNPGVTRLLFQALQGLPDDELSRLADRAVDWTTAPWADHFSEDAASVAVRLAEAGSVAEALRLAASLLQILPDPRRDEKVALVDSPLPPILEPGARISDWEYDRVVDRVLGPLVDRAGLAAVHLFADLLAEAIRQGGWEEDGSSEDDASHIWRPAIEDHEQNLDVGVKNRLVAATRDAATLIVSRSPSSLPDVIASLEGGSLVHQRIALFVLAEMSGVAPEVASQRIVNRSVFDDYRLRHEYAALLTSRFGETDDESRMQVLSWIEQGPDLDEYKSRTERFEGIAPTSDEVQAYADRWRRDRLSFIEPYLTEDEGRQYAEIQERVGSPDHPDFLSWSSSWIGPESPVSSDELTQLSPGDVAEYLRTWTPSDDSGWHFGPSAEGLGRVLSEVVAARPVEYAELAPSIADVDPTYVRSVLAGLEKAVLEGLHIPWEPVLGLALHVVSQPFELDEDRLDRDRDPGWRWSRRQVAALLRTGLVDKPNAIPFELRDSLWGILEPLTDDPNPSIEHEARYGGENMDPLTLSINTNRGTALHAVIEYGLWCRRSLETLKQDLSVGLDLMPEVREVLERHLDPAADPSLAVRAVYGRWLPWLILLDESWVVGHLPQLIPDEPDLAQYRDVIWATYIEWCPPFDSARRVLLGHYRTAIARVSESGESARGMAVDVKLGEHLVTFYWRGLDDDGLLAEWFSRADDARAATLMQFVGRTLRNTPVEPAEPLAERMRALADERLDVGAQQPEAHLAELRAFGTWFTAEKLGDEWAIELLERAVALAGAPTLGHLVAERLVAVAQVRPQRAVRVLAEMIRRPEHDWDYIGWRDEAKAIVRAAVDARPAETKSDVDSIVDFYVRRGELDFRELLPTFEE